MRRKGERVQFCCTSHLSAFALLHKSCINRSMFFLLEVDTLIKFVVCGVRLLIYNMMASPVDTYNGNLSPGHSAKRRRCNYGGDDDRNNCNISCIVPPELWSKIFELVPFTDMQSCAAVSRTHFYEG